MSKSGPDIANIRREYGELSLDEQNICADPLMQFQKWFDEVLKVEMNDPNAMVLSTVDTAGNPDSRVVLLKGVAGEAFVFFSNYLSTKGQQLNHRAYAALNFYWPQMARQVRIRGPVCRIAADDSDRYFASRPSLSQLSALASPQSQTIESRNVLEMRLDTLIQQYGQEPVPRPNHWGGYKVSAKEIEFWQGRDNRLHDRILYQKNNNQWQHRRLAP